MPRYYVVTPLYETGRTEVDPGETGADVVEVEAPTKRAAIVEGVRRMLHGNRREFKWCRNARGDGMNPFSGVKAFVVEEEPSEAS